MNIISQDHRECVKPSPESIQSKKKCSSCGEVKDSTEFYPKRNQCKDCFGAGRRKYRADNPERVKEWYRAWYAENRESQLEAFRQWYVENPDRAAENAARWHAENPEKVRESNRKWRIANPDKHRAKEARRRARKRGATVPEDAELIKKFYGHVESASRIRCYWCNRYVPKGKRHVDHIQPLAKGGLHAINNLCCACEGCNKSKGARTPEEFCGQGELFRMIYTVDN